MSQSARIAFKVLPESMFVCFSFFVWLQVKFFFRGAYCLFEPTYITLKNGGGHLYTWTYGCSVRYSTLDGTLMNVHKYGQATDGYASENGMGLRAWQYLLVVPSPFGALSCILHFFYPSLPAPVSIIFRLSLNWPIFSFPGKKSKGAAINDFSHIYSRDAGSAAVLSRLQVAHMSSLVILNEFYSRFYRISIFKSLNRISGNIKMHFYFYTFLPDYIFMFLPIKLLFGILTKCFLDFW